MWSDPGLWRHLIKFRWADGIRQTLAKDGPEDEKHAVPFCVTLALAELMLELDYYRLSAIQAGVQTEMEMGEIS